MDFGEAGFSLQEIRAAQLGAPAAAVLHGAELFAGGEDGKIADLAAVVDFKVFQIGEGGDGGDIAQGIGTVDADGSDLCFAFEEIQIADGRTVAELHAGEFLTGGQAVQTDGIQIGTAEEADAPELLRGEGTEIRCGCVTEIQIERIQEVAIGEGGVVQAVLDILEGEILDVGVGQPAEAGDFGILNRNGTETGCREIRHGRQIRADKIEDLQIRHEAEKAEIRIGFALHFGAGFLQIIMHIIVLIGADDIVAAVGDLVHGAVGVAGAVEIEILADNGDRAGGLQIRIGEAEFLGDGLGEDRRGGWGRRWRRCGGWGRRRRGGRRRCRRRRGGRRGRGGRRWGGCCRRGGRGRRSKPVPLLLTDQEDRGGQRDEGRGQNEAEAETAALLLGLGEFRRIETFRAGDPVRQFPG